MPPDPNPRPELRTVLVFQVSPTLPVLAPHIQDLARSPHEDQRAAKRRPAVVVSSSADHRGRPDIIVMAVTSRIRPPSVVGEVVVQRCEEAGLLKPSVLEPVFATLERGLVLRKLGVLQEEDRNAVYEALIGRIL